MRIGVICNNFGKSYDGIGAYSKVIYGDSIKDVDVEIYSADCKTDIGTLGKMLNYGMTSQINRLIRDIKHGEDSFDAIVIEYPFAEWNPIILIAFRRLSNTAKKAGIKVLTSVHEYERVNKLRKIIIEYLCTISDAIFVSNNEMGEALLRFCPKYFERMIPTNIYSDTLHFNDHKKRDSYVFFGLISKTKAFEEMLEGWDSFNRDGNNTLYILSGTKLGSIDEHKGVCYVYDCPPDKILDIMSECAFCIVPIRPCIDEKNATFKTGCLNGCVCLGHFDQKYSDLRFILNMKDYSPEEFKRAFAETQKITDEELLLKQQMSYEYGKRYTPRNVAAKVEKSIISLL
ncbi:hypothetical protein [Butyrivibrio sp. AC2005]|uniref:hypothetical protein n=1 Tax=Butyrivibrio sp. AC2005 TaxID=1280672 RepID=UPI0004289BA6|nr:hypothetical protein [Butyrivibrio sp. AC2005]